MQEKYLISISIIISSIILGAGIYFTTLINNHNSEDSQKLVTEKSTPIKRVNPLLDHIQGSKKADIYIIEYLDLECPGCKAFSKIEKTLIDKYAGNERVGFVYRHFPLFKSLGGKEALHPTSGIESRATECVAKLSKEEDFFKMKDKIFETTKSDGIYPVENLSSLAEEFGISSIDFSKCIESPEIKNKIENAWQEAYDAGVKGVPAVFIQIKSADKTYQVSPGKEIIDNAITSYLKNN